MQGVEAAGAPGIATTTPESSQRKKTQMFHTVHRGFHGRPQVPPPFPMLAGAMPPFHSPQCLGGEAQDPLRASASNVLSSVVCGATCT